MKKFNLNPLLIIVAMLLLVISIGTVSAEDPIDPAVQELIDKECPIPENGDFGDCKVYIFVYNETCTCWVMPPAPTIFEDRTPTTLTYDPSKQD